MATYTLKINVDEKWVKRFNDSDTKLCFASCVESGEEHFNMPASAKVVANTVTFTWTDTFGIAASHDSIEAGLKLTISTSIQEIKFQQSYTLPADWTDKTPVVDPTAPKFGFKFINQAVDATCVLFKKIDGEYAAIHRSAAGPLPPGTEKLTPKPKVRVWFATTKTDSFETTAMTIDFIGTTEQTVSYDASGVWAEVPSS